jgi:catechol-2,3-dioxygenase
VHVSAWNHVSLSVTDLDRSIGWYTEVLGFEMAFDEPESQGRRAVVLRFREGTPALGLTQHVDGGGPFDPGITGLDHAAFRVATAEELDEWAAHLDAHRIEHSGAIDIPPGRILNLKDPDGIALALFWTREG